MRIIANIEESYIMETLWKQWDYNFIDNGWKDGGQSNSVLLFEIKKNSSAEYNSYETMTEEEMLEKLKNSGEHCEEGRCCEANKVISDLRGKYGL